MISSVRESAGLGSPPSIYTTNRNESMNNVVNNCQSNWVSNMYDLIENQSKEVEKAVYGMGEYQFKAACKSLEVDSSKWFMMLSEQHQKHLRKVLLMQSTQFKESTPSTSGINQSKRLSIPPKHTGIISLSSELRGPG